MNKELEESLKLVPTLPGCYIYYDKNGEIIYEAIKFSVIGGVYHG